MVPPALSPGASSSAPPIRRYTTDRRCMEQDVARPMPAWAGARPRRTCPVGARLRVPDGTWPVLSRTPGALSRRGARFRRGHAELHFQLGDVLTDPWCVYPVWVLLQVHTVPF